MFSHTNSKLIVIFLSVLEQGFRGSCCLKWLRDDEGEGEKGHLRFEEEVWEKNQKPNRLSGR